MFSKHLKPNIYHKFSIFDLLLGYFPQKGRSYTLQNSFCLPALMHITRLALANHFWDMMDSLPIEAIPKIEAAILQNVLRIYQLEHDTLFFDTTNFFTYIDSGNSRCSLAQRGKNKQKRSDLRQVGLAMVVTRRDMIPLFHLTYQGNRNDSKIFKLVIGEIQDG